MKINRQITVVPRVPRHEEIERLAYDIWLNKGRPNGVSLECWLEAERRLTAESQSPRRSSRLSRKRPVRHEDNLEGKLDELLSRTGRPGGPRSPTSL